MLRTMAAIWSDVGLHTGVAQRLQGLATCDGGCTVPPAARTPGRHAKLDQGCCTLGCCITELPNEQLQTKKVALPACLPLGLHVPRAAEQ